MPAKSLFTKRAPWASTGTPIKESWSFWGSGLSAFIVLQTLGSSSLAFTYSCLILPQPRIWTQEKGSSFLRTSAEEWVWLHCKAAVCFELWFHLFFYFLRSSPKSRGFFWLELYVSVSLLILFEKIINLCLVGKTEAFNNQLVNIYFSFASLLTFLISLWEAELGTWMLQSHSLVLRRINSYLVLQFLVSVEPDSNTEMKNLLGMSDPIGVTWEEDRKRVDSLETAWGQQQFPAKQD